jgi:hypothetical protein
MRIKLARKFLIPIVIVALLATVVPAVSAYESHLINVRARVEERFHCSKTVRLAEADEIEYAEDVLGINFPSEPHGADSLTDPLDVPIETCVVWIARICIINTDNYCYTDLVITDHWGAELAGQSMDYPFVNLQPTIHTRGKSHKQSFEGQYRLTWYVTYISGDVSDPDDVDNSGELCPGESAHIEMYVWTDLNPAGRQEYTSPGDYTLNSGPTDKWLSVEDGHQRSSYSLPVYVNAY